MDIQTFLDESQKISEYEIREIYNATVLNGFTLEKQKFEVWHFCNNEEDANSLAELVRFGTKQATASLFDVYQAENEPIPVLGDISIIINFDGIPKTIIRTTKVEMVPFEEVSEEFVRIEGEGDKSLEYWKRVHIEFFNEEAEIFNLQFTPRSIVICEQFEVVKNIEF